MFANLNKNSNRPKMMSSDYSYEHDEYEYDESVEEEKEVKQFIIHPLSTFRLVWDLLTLVMLLFNLIMIPFGITYYKGEEFGYLFFKVQLCKSFALCRP